MTSYVCKKILEYVDVDENDLSDNTHLILDLHMNSYDCVNIVGNIEDELGIEIPDVEIKNLQTVGELSDYLKIKMK